jgi:protein-L-isoaspartate O-methyltransferase
MIRIFLTTLLLGFAGYGGAQDLQPIKDAGPYVPSPQSVVSDMLRYADVSANDFLIDLGSGDGRIVLAAAQKFGARGVGIEFDAALVAKSREQAQRLKLQERVSFVEGDVLVADISRASVVTVYLLPALMMKLQRRFIDELAPGTRIVSHAFTMAGWTPDRSETVKVKASHPGQGDESRLHLWIVPADVRGVWRGGGTELRIEQNFQQIDVEGASRASIAGRDISWLRGGVEFKGRVDGDRIVGPFVLERRR